MDNYIHTLLDTSSPELVFPVFGQCHETLSALIKKEADFTRPLECLQLDLLNPLGNRIKVDFYLTV
jgi:hypothetical protein